MNIDQSELTKFNQLEQDWWDEQGSLKTLHTINPVRMEFIQRNVSLKGKTILDVGCGGGILTEALAKESDDVIGIDLSENAIQAARLHTEKKALSHVQYQIISTEEFAQTQQTSFDVITCMEMLEHVPEPDSIIQSCHTLLKPGGIAFFATLNRNPVSYLKSILAAEHILKLLPKGTHDYAKFIKPSELIAVCRRCGLFIEDMAGLHYLPFLEQAYLSDKVDTNYMICVRKPG